MNFHKDYITGNMVQSRPAQIKTELDEIIESYSILLAGIRDNKLIIKNDELGEFWDSINESAKESFLINFLTRWGTYAEDVDNPKIDWSICRHDEVESILKGYLKGFVDKKYL